MKDTGSDYDAQLTRTYSKGKDALRFEVSWLGMNIDHVQIQVTYMIMPCKMGTTAEFDVFPAHSVSCGIAPGISTGRITTCITILICHHTGVTYSTRSSLKICRSLDKQCLQARKVAQGRTVRT